MKRKLFIIGFVIFAFILSANNILAQDKAHEAAMLMLKEFLADQAARVDYAAKNPGALQAEQNLSQFPSNIQKRIEKIVLMIMQESGENASKYVDTSKALGQEGAFNSFSPSVQKEIENLARELEKDPDFMKKAGSLKP
ncbi:MAG: hypothetical protein CSYNP_02139 [Syntrophus sp. SKADARSKE-3]|nr:hypothetical protein [Syntrophus sp. SKADARSKE-3]